ncbi:MAG TPA: dihydropteroate synthase, partial [Gemmatimonadaceae bacterium]|nr:dihydropteroate synthase [Gemmatimonadaceae bacterium]
VPVPEATELERVLPVIEAVRDRLPNAIVTIDTVKASVARAALAAGAHAVNDVSGGRLDPAMFEVVATAGAGMIIMHSRGTVADMASYTHADYGDVTAEVGRDLLAQVALARAAGIAEACIVLDPGLGFAKRSEHSITLLHELPRLVALGYPVLVGASRKRFIGDVTGVRVPAQRAIGSAVAHALAVQRGASIVRTHDVRATCEALAVMQALTPSPH